MEAIYSSVPAKNIQEIDAEAKSKIAWMLINNKGNFYTAYEIAEECNLPTKGTQVEVRKAITEMIELSANPIVSCDSGFAWATCSNMMKKYSESLDQRMAGLHRRKKAVDEIYITMKREEKRKEDLRRY